MICITYQQQHIKMIKVAPYIATIGDEKFKEFLVGEFKMDMLNTLFADWREKDMLSWKRFTNGDDVRLEFYASNYNVKKGAIQTEFSIPKTIDDFINDMQRTGVQLYWTIWIDENFEPKQYLPPNKIEDYYRDVLRKMDKSKELL